MRPAVGRLLLDFDGVLALYRHERRIAHLAALAGCGHEHVRAVVFTSGLERAYDSGALDTAAYLHHLGEGLGHAVDAEAWIGSRLVGSDAAGAVIARLRALDPALPMAILTNNGALMAEAIPRIVGPLAPRIEGRVLCSGALGVRKPDPAAFVAALQRLGWDAAGTLFIDDSFANVQAARRLGLHAETATDARALGRVLKRYALA